MTATTTARTNAFPGKCARCRQTVPAGEGILTGSRNLGWTTTHAGTCPEPKPVAPVTQPDLGIYVTPEGEAIKVVKSQMSGKHYTKLLTFSTQGDRTVMDWTYAPGLSVEGLPRMPDHMAAEIGLKCQQCVNCLAALGGITMAAKVSAVIGYGATCAGNNGWAFPRGVRAQREFLASKGVAA